MTGSRAYIAAAVACLACACTTDEPSPGAEAVSSTSPSSAVPSTARTTTSNTTAAPAPAVHREPLALAVNIHRSALRLTEAQARRIIAGNVATWSQLGQRGGALRVRTSEGALDEAAGDAGVVAVVPASAVTPFVQVAIVGDVDPLVHPARYPITVKTGEEPPTVTTMTIVGDIMLGRGVGAATPNDPGSALQPLTRRLAAADLTIGNLESTLSKDGPPQQGGDSFDADPRVVGALTDAGFDLLSLGNNHTGDFGDRALRQTVARLDASAIERVGAGVDRRDAWQPAVFEHVGVRFGFVAFNAIGETPRATPNSPGAAEVRMQPRTGPINQADLRRVTRAVSRLDRQVDVVVVLPHWGDQYTAEPVADQRTVGAALIDAGADIVVGGHPHWVQGIDVHDRQLIVNSLGNFVFDMDTVQTNQGVMLELVCWDDRLMSVRFVPYVIGADFAPRPVGDPEASRILRQMWRASDPPFETSR